MKVAVIGAGGWGKNIVRTLHGMGALDSVTELSAQLREGVEQTYDGVTTYASVEDMLSNTDCPVILATPVNTHYKLGKLLLEHSRDVFIEKPMAMNAEECAELNALANKQGNIIMVGHLLIYQPAIQFIKDFIEQGKLGKLHALYQVRRNLGTVRTHENALYSLGVHDFAVLDYLIGKAPISISSVGQSALNPGVEDDVTVHLNYSNGLKAHLHTSWLWPIKERYMVVSGEKGMLRFDELTQTVTFYKYTYNKEAGITKAAPAVVFQNEAAPLEAELSHFIDCCQKRSKPKSGGEQGQRVVVMIEQAMEQL